MRIGMWSAMVLVLLAGGEALAQPVCDAGGPYFASTAVPIQFDGTGSHSPGGSVVSYTWDFGDGTTGTGPTPEHTYFGYGPEYAVSLTVLANDQTSSTCQTTVLMNYEPGPPACDAAGPYYGTINSPIPFYGSGSSAPGGTIVDYAWDFGDGATGSGGKPEHIYVADGTYTVTLTVTEDQGASSTCTTTVSVSDGGPTCDAGGPYYAAIHEPIQFDGTGSYDPKGGPIIAYEWSFGDGDTASGATPQHAFRGALMYIVSLTVHDERGGQSTCTSYAVVSTLAIEPATWGRIKSRYR
jgi:PKD repeat protein